MESRPDAQIKLGCPLRSAERRPQRRASGPSYPLDRRKNKNTKFSFFRKKGPEALAPGRVLGPSRRWPVHRSTTPMRSLRARLRGRLSADHHALLVYPDRLSAHTGHTRTKRERDPMTIMRRSPLVATPSMRGIYGEQISPMRKIGVKMLT